MNNSRRGFFKGALGVLAAGTLGSVLVNAEARRRPRGGDAAGGGATGGGAGAKPGDLPLLDPNAPQAKAMSYSEKHADVKNAALKIERQGLAFEKQFCNNCGFFTKIDDKKGKCTIFAANSVKQDAWCSSWNKKA